VNLAIRVEIGDRSSGGRVIAKSRLGSHRSVWGQPVRGSKISEPFSGPDSMTVLTAVREGVPPPWPQVPHMDHRSSCTSQSSTGRSGSVQLLRTGKHPALQVPDVDQRSSRSLRRVALRSFHLSICNHDKPVKPDSRLVKVIASDYIPNQGCHFHTAM
jgi:hypothetical protein